MTTTTKTVPVVCVCGKRSMTVTVTTEGDRRLFVMRCEGCGEEIREATVRREVTATVCGPGSGSGKVTLGHIWAPEVVEPALWRAAGLEPR